MHGLEVLSEHTGGEGGLRDVHDAGDGGAGGTDDLGLEGDVELTHFGITRDGGVGRTGKGLDRVVGQFACSAVVVKDGAGGGDVVGDRTDLLVDGCGTVGHHVSHVGDGVAVEVSGRGGTGPVLLGFGTVVVGANAVLGEGGEVVFDGAFNGSGGHWGEGSDVQQDQNDSSQQHVSG